MSEQPKAMELADTLESWADNYATIDEMARASAEILRTQHTAVQSLLKEVERLKRENHNLNWALGTDGYDQMATPEEQAQHEAGMAKVNANLERFKNRSERFAKIVPNGTDLLEFVEKQHAEVERLRKDAARYRWLRSQHEESDSAESFCVFQPATPSDLEPVGCMPGELDEAIDAARGAKHWIARKEQEGC